MLRSTICTIAIICLGVMSFASIAESSIIYVPGDYLTIEDGCAAMQEGDILEIAPGVYYVDTADVAGIKCVIRGATGNPADVILRPATPDSRVFYLLSGWLPNLFTLEHLTFQGAPTSPSGRTGGGILMSGLDSASGLLIKNCVFQFFHSLRAIDFRNAGYLQVIDCVFRDNHGGPRSGGAFEQTVESGLLMRGCQFLNNYSADKGGAIRINNSPYTILENCTFAGNYSVGDGGALATQTGFLLRLVGCTFVENQAGGEGGAIAVSGPYVHIPPQIHRCLIAFNEGAPIGNSASEIPPEDLVITGTNIYGNSGGDWVAPWGVHQTNVYNSDQANFAVDPLFCDLAGGDYGLQSDSPCLVLGIGAHGEGCGSVSGVPEEIQLAHTAIESRNTPNPFNPQTSISFELKIAGPVVLQIFDVRGLLVRSLLDERRDAGEHQAIWDGLDDTGRQVSSGVYLSRLLVEGNVVQGRMALVR